MEDYIINVGQVEQWQMINDISCLDELFHRARRVLVGGGTVLLQREQRSGETWKVGEYTNLDDFEDYRKNVYKHLKE